MVKKFIISIILSTYMLSGSATAKNGNIYTSCGATSAKLWENIKINKIYSDITINGSGFYVESNNGGTWRVDQAELYPKNYLTYEFRRIAMAALLTGTLVNICASKHTSPATVWSMQLVN